MVFPGGSDSKESACNARGQVQSLGRENSLEDEMATHCSIPAWKIPWTKKPGRHYSPWGHRESDTTERLTLHHYYSGEWDWPMDDCVAQLWLLQASWWAGLVPGPVLSEAWPWLLWQFWCVWLALCCGDAFQVISEQAKSGHWVRLSQKTARVDRLGTAGPQENIRVGWMVLVKLMVSDRNSTY